MFYVINLKAAGMSRYGDQLVSTMDDLVKQCDLSGLWFSTQISHGVRQRAIFL